MIFIAVCFMKINEKRNKEYEYAAILQAATRRKLSKRE
jgi:hypothetical protein